MDRKDPALLICYHILLFLNILDGWYSRPVTEESISDNFSLCYVSQSCFLTSEEWVEVSKDLENHFQQDGHWSQPCHQLWALFNGWNSVTEGLTADTHIPLGFPIPEFPLKAYLPLISTMEIRALAQEKQDLLHHTFSGRCWNHTFLVSESSEHVATG